ncbi:MAG: tetratricopeptide repeat protein [Thermoplasmata archaeon]|nr:tetratricopeptide repeat protein [Thermoplasmata archaeon]
MRNREEDKAQILLRRILRWITEDMDKVSKMSDEYKKRVSELLTEAGENMLILKDYNYAIKMLEKAKTLNYKNVKAWLDIGRNLLQRNTQIPYGISCLQEAVKIDPNNVEAHILLGDGYRLQGQIEKALKEYKRVLELEESNEMALEKFLKIEPNNIEVLKKYAEVLEKKGDRENLLVVYNKLASLTNDESYIDKGLQLDPDNKDLLITKAYTLKQQNKYSEALEVAKNLMEKYPDDPAVQLLYGEIVETEEEEFKPIEVEELFGDLGIEGIEEVEVEEKPSHEDFLNYYENGQIEKALKTFEKLDKEEREKLIKSYGNLQLAETLFDHGKIRYAEKIVEILLEKERTQDALYLKARILIEGGQLEEGEKYLNEILKRNIRHASALFQKARITCVKGNEMGTRNFLTMAIKLSPEIKEMVKKDSILQKYAEKEWFKKLIL